MPDTTGLSKREIIEAKAATIDERARAGILRAKDQERLDELRALLDGPPLPPAVSYLYEWFVDLHGYRQSSEAGPQRLTAEQMLAWCQLWRRQLAPWEIDALKKLDVLWIKCWNEARADVLAQQKAAAEARRKDHLR